MSAQTMLPAWAAPGDGANAKVSTPGLALLTKIELRKMVNTRAGRWLLIIIGLLVAGVIAVIAIWGDSDQAWADYSQLALLPIGILGPVVGILTVTSEWSQRTALTTFTLVPQRGRIITAKFLAAMILAASTLVMILPIAALATLATGSGDSGAWDMSGLLLFELLMFLLINFANGVAFGLLFNNTPVAIVSFFVLPVVWNLLAQIKSLQSVGEWLDINSTMSVLGSGESTHDDWAKIAATTLLWVVLPMVIGTVRTLRREVK